MISKKIIHLITTIEMGGAEKQLLILAREQKKLGLVVEVIYLKGKPELKTDFQLAGCEVNDFVANKNFIFQLFILARYLRKNTSPIHAHLPKSELVAAVSCPKGKFIFTRHNSEDFWPGMPKVFSKLLSKLVCLRAVQGIAISNAVKNYLIKTGEVSKKYQLDVVHYGYAANLEDSSNKNGEIIKVLNKSKAKFKIGAIGRLADQKDYPTLLRAFKKLQVVHKESELFIVGDGPKKQFLKNLCKNLEIEHEVHFLGRSPFVLEFLKLVDIFVLPSKYEGFGLVLLEAMSVKTPIIASNNSSIPEVLGIDYLGLFKTGNVEELSNLINLVKDQNTFSASLINQYSERLINFEPEHMAWKIQDIYEKSRF